MGSAILFCPLANQRILLSQAVPLDLYRYTGVINLMDFSLLLPKTIHVEEGLNLKEVQLKNIFMWR
jgi:hypothetical protein